MKKYTATLLLGFLLFTAAGALAQSNGTIRGTVTDQENGEVIPGVNVRLVGTNKGSATNTAGKYKISKVDPGQYRIEATFLGFAAYKSDSFEVGTGQTVTLDITLKKTVWQGNEVVVTGSKKPEKLLESPTTIERISQEEIETSGGSTFMSSLSNLKGVDYTDAGINTQLVSARGFNSSFSTRMLFLVDGRLATLGGTGLPQGNFLPSSKIDLKSMEVVLGPASALYGPNAGSGVVNVATKDPWDDSGVTISSRVGNQELRDITYRAAGTINDHFGWKVTGQFMKAVDFKPQRKDSLHFYQAAGTKPTSANTVFETDVVDDYDVGAKKFDGALYYKAGGWKVSGKYGWSSTSQFALTANGRNRIEDWEVNYQTLTASNDHWYAQVSRNGNDAGSYQLNQVVPAVQAAYNGGVPAAQFDVGALRESLAFVDDTKTYDSELQYNNSLGGLDLVAGINYRNYQPFSDGTYLNDGSGQDISRELFGGYLQLDYDLFPDRLKLVAAARVDDNSDYDTQFSPKASMVLTVAPGHNLRASFNRAYTTPTILQSHASIPVDLSAQAPGYALLIKGNTEGFTIKDPSGTVVNTIDPTVPEIVNSLEAGYKGTFGDQLFVDIVAYQSWYKNFIGTSSVADGFQTIAYQDGQKVLAPGSSATLLQTYINYGEARVQGLDIGLNYYLSDQYNLSLSMSSIKLADFNNDKNSTTLPLNTPPLKLKGGITANDIFKSSVFTEPFLKINGRWREAYEYVSGYWNSNVLLADDGNVGAKHELPSKFQLDLSAGFDISDSGLSLKASMNNVLDTNNVDLLGTPPMGRTFWMSLTYDFDGFKF